MVPTKYVPCMYDETSLVPRHSCVYFVVLTPNQSTLEESEV